MVFLKVKEYFLVILPQVSMFPEAAWLSAAAYDKPEWFNNIPLVDGFDAEFFKRDSLHLYMKRPAGVKGVDEQ
jgi:hypothetical protein